MSSNLILSALDDFRLLLSSRLGQITIHKVFIALVHVKHPHSLPSRVTEHATMPKDLFCFQMNGEQKIVS
jgi:hypothetical protein